MSRYDRVRADGRPAVIQSTYCNRYCHYLFRPGHWCANVVPSFGQATFVDLPDQPGLKKNVVYKVKSFPVEFSPAKYILIFNMDSEKYLKPYNRTGWEFTAPWPSKWVLLALFTTKLLQEECLLELRP